MRRLNRYSCIFNCHVDASVLISYIFHSISWRQAWLSLMFFLLLIIIACLLLGKMQNMQWGSNSGLFVLECIVTNSIIWRFCDTKWILANLQAMCSRVSFTNGCADIFCSMSSTYLKDSVSFSKDIMVFTDLVLLRMINKWTKTHCRKIRFLATKNANCWIVDFIRLMLPLRWWPGPRNSISWRDDF